MGLSLEQLEAEFADFNLAPGRSGPLVLSGTVAISFIERAAAEGYSVLGIEAFHVRPSKEGVGVLPDGSSMRHAATLQPDQEHSIDYTLSTGDMSGAPSQAVTFVREHASFVTDFEVVLNDEANDAGRRS